MSKTGRIAKITVISIMYILIGLFIFRCCFASNRSTLNDLVPRTPCQPHRLTE